MTMLNHTTAPVRSYGWLRELRSSLSERRQANAARRTLETELATYRTPAEVEDLFAALRREDDNPTAEEMRSILFQNLQGAAHARTAA
jgi:hypothetical protein